MIRSDADPLCPAVLAVARRGGADPDRYVAPTDDERRALTESLQTLLSPAVDAVEQARSRVSAAGFVLEAVPEIPGTWVVREGVRRRGGGVYLVRAGSPSRLAVQAPHSFYDEGSLPLACALFRASTAAALFVNTAHRYKAAAVTAEGVHPADVAHAPGTLFQAATAGFLMARTNARVVQLHGFGPRESNVAAVVSSGERSADHPLVDRIAAALIVATGASIVRFPEESAELGATTNVQGAAVRAARGEFVHIEMSRGLRSELVDDAAKRARFISALAAQLDAP